jgi:hypothetical protein
MRKKQIGKRYLQLQLRCNFLNTSVADPVPELYLVPGSGIQDEKKIRIRDKHPGTYFQELSYNFLG